MGFSPVTVTEERVYVTVNVSDIEDPLVTNSFIVYSDLNQNNPSEDPLLYNMDSVGQAMFNLFHVQQGERIFRPTYGADLRRYLFAPINEATSIQLRQLLMVSVEQWDRRIRVDRNYSRVTPLPDDNAYEIYIVYRVLGIPEQAYAYEAILAI